MSILYDSISYQPIEEKTEDDEKYFQEVVLPLVRRVFRDIATGKYEKKEKASSSE